MIIVDIFVPVLNKSYDFSINEKMPIALLTEEISEMVAQKEGCINIKHPESFVICNLSTKSILNSAHTLEEYGVENGSRLALI